MRETGNGKRETGNGKREKGKLKIGTKQRIENENTDRAAVPTSFPGFSPTRPFGLSKGRRENMGTRLLGFKLGLVPVFHFPVSRFNDIPKNPTSIIFFFRKLGNGSGQPFLRYSTCFHLFFGRIW